MVKTENRHSKKLLGAGIVTAISASLCCITPVLAFIAGSAGIASSFSWLEPLRPFLIGFTVIVLGFTWYQQWRVRKEAIACGCEDEPVSFWQSKKMLVIITIFSGLMLAFPYYAHIFYPAAEKQMTINENHIMKAKLNIDGMTCTGCEGHVRQVLNAQEGVIEVSASYREGVALVEFDTTKVSLDKMARELEAQTAYTVTAKKHKE